MLKITRKNVYQLALAGFLSIALVGCGGKETEPISTPKESPNETSEMDVSSSIPEPFKKDLNIVFVNDFTTGDFQEELINSFNQSSNSMGINVEIKDAKGDKDKYNEFIKKAIEENKDGIVLSHCDGDSVTSLFGSELESKNIPIVSFDCSLDIKTATSTSQDDHKLAIEGLNKMNTDLQNKGKIVYLWVDGFAPMIKRNEEYVKFMENNKGYKEVGRFGVATATTAEETEKFMTDFLSKNPKGSIDAVWSTWDEFSKGATNAIIKTGRTEIKLYSVDISSKDLEMMKQENSPWVASVAVSPKSIGTTMSRIMAFKIAGKDTPDTYTFEPSVISKDNLPTDKDVLFRELFKYVDGWGVSEDFKDEWLSEVIMEKSSN